MQITTVAKDIVDKGAPMITLNGLLRNRNFIFIAALVLGLFLPGASETTSQLILPALALTMILSTMEIGNDLFRRPRTLLLPAFIGILMNYILLSGIIIGLGAILLKDEKLWAGTVLLAAVPPAVAVIPFSGFLKGNRNLSLIGTAGAYLGGLVVMPLIAFTLLSPEAFAPLKLLVVVLELIILPLIISRLLIWRGWSKRISPWAGGITNWSFFLVMYTLVGLNSAVFLSLQPVLLAVAVIPFSTNFILGFLIERIGGFLKISAPTRTSLVLLGSLKNQGMAGGLALTLFGKEAAIPAAVCTASMIVYIIWLDLLKRANFKKANR
ncbi:MAG: bile acid:sodium symporter family protein [Syntrophales bacterium]